MSTPPQPPIAIDLFSGCGGLTEGLKQANFKVIGAIELEDLEVETYQANHPDVENVWANDIRALETDQIQAFFGLAPGELDLLAGCPPCQGFSSLRTRNGSLDVDDPRNDLVLEFVRFIDQLRPCSIMMENVPGLAEDSRFEVLLHHLDELGYYAGDDAVQILNTADFGVPQRRRRMILLTGLNGPIQPAPPSEERVSVRTAIQDLPPAGKSNDPPHDFPERRSERVMNLIRRIPHDGGSRTDLDDDKQLDCHKRCNGFNDVYGRMAWDEVAPTITGGCVNPSKGRYLHPNKNRSITLREAALLQSFPEDYHFSLRRGKFAAAKMIGNALPPEFVRRHAEQLRTHLT